MRPKVTNQCLFESLTIADILRVEILSQEPPFLLSLTLWLGTISSLTLRVQEPESKFPVHVHINMNEDVDEECSGVISEALNIPDLLDFLNSKRR